MIVNEPERRGRIFFFIWTGILFVGIAVMLYPKVGKLWNAGRQSRVVDPPAIMKATIIATAIRTTGNAQDCIPTARPLMIFVADPVSD